MHFDVWKYRNSNLEVTIKRFRIGTYMEVCVYSIGYTWLLFVFADEFSVMLTKFTPRMSGTITHNLAFWFYH